MTTPVIFRKFKDGEVIAIFPTIPASHKPVECLSYMHIGQHGACNYYAAILRQTSLATEEEYADLQQELIRRGYDDLKVYKRWQMWFYQERIKEMRGKS